MVLIADSGWSYGEIGYGEDKLVQMGEAVNAARVEQGLKPRDWTGELPSPARGEGDSAAAERGEGADGVAD